MTTAPTFSSFKIKYGTSGEATGVITTGATNTIAVTVPYGTTVTALVAVFTVNKGDSTDTVVKVGATSQTSGTTTNDFTSPVTYSVQDSVTATTKTDYVVTVTVAEPSYDTMVEHNINAAGWYKVKKVTFKEFKYQTNGFIPAYRLQAVLAVNVPGGITALVYDDTSGTAPVQKVKLYAGTSEVSNNTRISGDMFFLLE